MSVLVGHPGEDPAVVVRPSGPRYGVLGFQIGAHPHAGALDHGIRSVDLGGYWHGARAAMHTPARVVCATCGFYMQCMCHTGRTTTGRAIVPR